MKSIKAKSIQELKEKVIKTDLFQQWIDIKIGIEKKIKDLQDSGEYVERDLYEELSSINRALNINYHSKNIKRGVRNNQGELNGVYLYNGGGHSCITLIEYPYSFYIFDHYSFH